MSRHPLELVMLDFLQNLVIPIRWLHVLTAAAWYGEVIVINFVLIPAIRRTDIEARNLFLLRVFPGIFRLASILSATVVVTGTLLTYIQLKGEWSRLLSSGTWGYAIFIGGLMAWFITIFHFFIEGWLSKKLGYDSKKSPTAMAELHVAVSTIPRLAMLVLSLIFVMMMIAARGLPAI